MPQMKRFVGDGSLFNLSSEEERNVTEEEHEDHLDYCAAVEAIDEALEEGGMKRTRDFARELGFDF